jgi:hypothetical protein
MHTFVSYIVIKNTLQHLAQANQAAVSVCQIMAHEVGHNLGMNHDFSGSAGTPRYDSKGVSCTNIGAVMDYNQV